jgi:ArsR family transcriptional regulator
MEIQIYFLTFVVIERNCEIIAGGLMPQLSALQLFKNLSDETRLGIVLLLRDGRAVRVRSLYSAGTVTAQDLPPSGNAPGKWPIAGSQAGKWVHYRLSPHIPSWAAQVIEQAWLSNRTTYRPSPVSWHRQTALVAVRLFVSKKFA